MPALGIWGDCSQEGARSGCCRAARSGVKLLGGWACRHDGLAAALMMLEPIAQHVRQDWS